MAVTSDAPAPQQANILKELRAELGWSEERAAATAGVSPQIYMGLEDLAVLPASSRSVVSLLESAEMRGAVRRTPDGTWEVVHRMSETEVSAIVDNLGRKNRIRLLSVSPYGGTGRVMGLDSRDTLRSLHARRLIEFGAETIKVVYEGAAIEELTANQRVRRTRLGDAVVDEIFRRETLKQVPLTIAEAQA